MPTLSKDHVDSNIQSISIRPNIAKISSETHVHRAGTIQVPEMDYEVLFF